MPYGIEIKNQLGYMERELFPLGRQLLVNELREALGLPVDSPSQIQDSTIQRFLKWHRWRWRLPS